MLCSSADKTAHLLDLNQDGDRLAGQQIAVHDSAISSIRFVTTPAAGAEIAVTASWDRKLRYWDLRSSNPLGELDLSERIYAMDTAENLLVAGTADNKLHFIDLTKPMEIARTVDAELKKEITAPGIRDIACRKDGKSCFVATVEGRILERFANPANKADKLVPSDFLYHYRFKIL